VGAGRAHRRSMIMTNFESKALGKKFDRIVLGTLSGAGAAASAAGGMTSPHAGVAMARGRQQREGGEC